tara:strand:- start:255 stop:596 length:342 start_codon:yes stop_codon:yes gene_type:complete
MDESNESVDNGAKIISKAINVQPVDMGDTLDDRVYTINDLPELVSQGESEKVLEILKAQRTATVMSPTKSKAAKRRELKDLQDLAWSAYREFGREISRQEWKSEIRLMFLGNN